VQKRRDTREVRRRKGEKRKGNDKEKDTKQ
jgi:hypothetical protein